MLLLRSGREVVATETPSTKQRSSSTSTGPQYIETRHTPYTQFSDWELERPANSIKGNISLDARAGYSKKTNLVKIVDLKEPWKMTAIYLNSKLQRYGISVPHFVASQKSGLSMAKNHHQIRSTTNSGENTMRHRRMLGLGRKAGVRRRSRKRFHLVGTTVYQRPSAAQDDNKGLLHSLVHSVITRLSLLDEWKTTWVNISVMSLARQDGGGDLTWLLSRIVRMAEDNGRKHVQLFCITSATLESLNHKVLSADIMSARGNQGEKMLTYLQRNRNSTFQLNRPYNSSNHHLSGAAADWKSQREFPGGHPGDQKHESYTMIVWGCWHVSPLILPLIVSPMPVFEPGDSNHLDLVEALKTSYQTCWEPLGVLDTNLEDSRSGFRLTVSPICILPPTTCRTLEALAYRKFGTLARGVLGICSGRSAGERLFKADETT
ncbi:uncharacterized protein BT62DRAFT_1000849 [Guyanagaster necrorhizus]|uniref:Uncharacterized protein n=1 Tax=Guyanagaster necrorhizus TaxID=856835 RepID=A0A9P8AXG6_9AGAR|nr:uncharacterized protein BT62DRAFT_1000849 [Guyanagaster necrorhizus MCA 3950]KAG7451593.1 hypothetical protein BT62DRAFT_1000849 [Guyanagaster necrorhizus MCA 3950]